MRYCFTGPWYIEYSPVDLLTCGQHGCLKFQASVQVVYGTRTVSIHWITCDLFQVTPFVLSAIINLFAL